MADTQIGVRNNAVELGVRISGLDQYFAANEGAKKALLKDVAATLLGTANEIRDRARAIAPKRRDMLRYNRRAQSAEVSKGGALARGIWSRVKVREDSVTARASPRARQFYGKFLERGIPEKTVKVRMYVRSDKGGGREEVSRRRQTLALHYGARTWRKVVTGGRGVVKAHDRKMHLAARKFMTPAFEPVKGLVEQRIVDAANHALAARAP